jgi:hypothetical protein
VAQKREKGILGEDMRMVEVRSVILEGEMGELKIEKLYSWV